MGGTLYARKKLLSWGSAGANGALVVLGKSSLLAMLCAAQNPRQLNKDLQLECDRAGVGRDAERHTVEERETGQIAAGTKQQTALQKPSHLRAVD
jgi:hypothetical protein